MFDPAGVLLVVSREDPARDPAWAAPIRARFAAEAAAATATAASGAAAARRVRSVARRIVSLETAGGGEPSQPGCDLALIATPIGQVEAALELAAAHGARAAAVLDRCDDDVLARRLVEKARALHIRLLGPGSMGMMCPPVRLDASRLGRLPAAGNVALVSQSGVLAGAVLDWAGDTAIGFSLVVSLGFEADVDLAQVLDYLAGDSRTKAVVVYLEAVSEARGFMSALRALATVKPVVVLKAGRDATTRTGARTHSGAIAAADAVYSAALRRAGAVQVRLFTQLFTAVRYLAARNWPLGKRLAIVSNGHGPAMLAADQAWSQGIRLLPFGDATAMALSGRLPGVEPANPLNLGVDASPTRFAEAIEALAQDADSDALLVLMSPSGGVDARAITDRVVSVSRGFAKPLFACWLGDSSVRELRAKLDAAGLPVFRTPEAAVDAFSTVGTFHQNQLLLQQVPRSLSDMEAPDVAGARAVVEAALAQGREVLSEVESKALLAAFRIPVTRTMLARDADQAESLAGEIGYPVVMKIASHDVTHKSDVGGVSLNVRNAAEVRAQFAAILESVRHALPAARIEGVTIQPMVRGRGARELYVGVFRNRLFGPVIAFGAGGTRVEVVRDTTLEFPPLNGFLARSMIGRTRVAATLGEFRGAPAVDDEALARVLVRVSEMVCELPQLAEMDINPLIADERGAIAVDARIVLDRTPVAAGPRYGHMAIMPYPAHLSRRVTLRDGRPYLLRPIQAEDADRLQRFTRGLSQQSRYFRFISTLNELTPRMLVRYTQIDYDRELALVAVCRADDAGRTGGDGDAGAGDRERIIGVARYLLNPDRDTCEFAIAVGDDFQGQGLGTTLMQALIDEARLRGLKRMEGYVLAINAPMIRLMRALGFTIDRDPDDETLKLVWIALDGPTQAGHSAA
jgi:acetyltransferase